MLGGALAILALVMAIFLLSMVRGGEGTAERPWLLWGGLVFPVAVLLVLLGAALWTGERLLPRDGPDVVQVEAASSQYRWDFVSRDVGGGAARGAVDVLRIPAGVPVDVAVTTDDVIHSFWVPRLAGKIDAIPGHRNVLRIQADAPGTYRGMCAEYCGIGHSRHLFVVEAMEPGAYAAWVAGEGE